MKTSFIDFFEKTVRSNRGKTAIIHNDDEVTFEELRNLALGCASEILSLETSSRCRPVAIFMPKRIEVAVADIACIYSGMVFMNLDVSTPLDRISNILKLIQPVLILTDTDRLDAISSIAEGIPVMTVARECKVATASEQEEIERRRVFHIDTDPLCIINTSGSTGTPKGVVLNSKSFFDFLSWSVEAFGFDGNEVIGGLSPVVFDLYNFELFTCMTQGSTIVMLDANKAAFPALLLQEVHERGINFIFWVPSIMVNIANMGLLDEIDLSALRLVWFAGEVFPTKQFNYWKHHLPNTVFANLYGPIEITLDCTYMIIDRDIPDDTPLPIGHPCHNTDILILNENDEVCAVGEKGELCVRGTSLAMGYYNNPEKTAAAFVQNPLNHSYPELIYRTGDIAFVDDSGEIQFRGRKDSLVKHMGYRIELAEIEHVIVNNLKLTKYCCVVYDHQNKDIVLFYESPKDFDLVKTRRSMLTELPKYMIPTRYVRMDELPRNVNGKIDRKQLASLIG